MESLAKSEDGSKNDGASGHDSANTEAFLELLGGKRTGLEDFLGGLRSKRPLRLHKSYQQAQQSLWQDDKKLTEVKNIDDLVKLIADSLLGDVLPLEWFSAASFAKLCIAKHQYPDVAAEVFPDNASLDTFLKCRGLFLVNLICDLTEDDATMQLPTGRALRAALTKYDYIPTMASHVDRYIVLKGSEESDHQACKDAWVGLWVQELRTLCKEPLR